MYLFITKKFKQLVIALFLAVLLFSTCNNETGTRFFSILKQRPDSSENLIIAFKTFLESMNTPDRKLFRFSGDSVFVTKDILNKKIFSEPDLNYLPLTLRQASSINGKEWNSEAKNVSDYLLDICRIDSTGHSILESKTLSEIYFYTQEKKYLEIFIKNLSDEMCRGEQNPCADSISQGSLDDKISRLKNIPVFFYASQVTGDPVYRNFTLRNSEEVYRVYYQRFQENGIDLNANIQPNYSDKEKLNEVFSAIGLENLVISLYGFNFLGNETGILKYEQLAYPIARYLVQPNGVFSTKHSANSLFGATCKSDLIIHGMLINTLKSMKEHDGVNFKALSEEYFKNVINALNDSKIMNAESMSFQLFYYLLEYKNEKLINNS